MASISPGPDFVVVSQKTILQGRKAGVFCGIGVCIGLLFHIGYSVAGLTVAFNSATWLTQSIGIFGGSYLIYLGYNAIKSSFSNNTTASIQSEKNSDTCAAFWSGLIVNIFNPKAAIYFISLFSMVVSPSLETEKLLLLIVCIIAVQMTWYLTFIFIVTIPKIKVQFDKKVYLIDRILGALMLMMGLYMIAIYAFH